jgi:hypothetical protein
MNHCNWSEQEVAVLVENYPHRSTKQVAELLNKTVKQCYCKASMLKLYKTNEYLATDFSGRIRNSNIKAQFLKGNIPWNKGMKGLQIGGEQTQFKKGTIPPNHRPVGSTRIDEEGYTYIKIAEPRKWALLHRHIYEQEYGKINRNEVIVFRDKNRSNFEIGNLEKISMSENMERNRITKYPIEIQETIKALNKLWHAIK